MLAALQLGSLQVTVGVLGVTGGNGGVLAYTPHSSPTASRRAVLKGYQTPPLGSLGDQPKILSADLRVHLFRSTVYIFFVFRCLGLETPQLGIPQRAAMPCAPS